MKRGISVYWLIPCIIMLSCMVNNNVHNGQNQGQGQNSPLNHKIYWT